jgi:DNA/RNA endonuclease G (NUC1)
MVNIIPQYPSINRHTWIKTEKLERQLAVKLGMIRVLIGVIYENNPQRIGKNKVAVPKAYYKKLYNNDVGYKKCFYYNNSIDVVIKGDKLKNHLVDCNNLQILANTHTQKTEDKYTLKQKQHKSHTHKNKKIKNEDTHKKYDCNKKVYCGTIKSCDEAMYYLNVCNLKRLDRDKDNIPCEKFCK